MICKTCSKKLTKTFCSACMNTFISCDCTPNICMGCREVLYSDPARHRFDIAWLTLLDCLDHMDDDLPELEQKAKENLIALILEWINKSLKKEGR